MSVNDEFIVHLLSINFLLMSFQHKILKSMGFLNGFNMCVCG